MSGDGSASPVEVPRRRRTALIVALSTVGAIVIVAVVFAIMFVVAMSRPVPEFPSLASTPDPSLHGTVAYFDDQRMCVRVISASGAQSKDVLCIASQQPSEAAKVGKDVGVNLFWRDDNRLEMTLYRMTEGGPNPIFTPAWQKVADVVTGAIVETPLSDVATAPNTNAHPTVTPDGAALSTTSDSGHVVVTLTDSSGTRDLLNVTGPPETYGIAEAYWAPDFRWAVTTDGRVLVITPSNPGVTRVLIPAMTMFYGDDALSRYTVTGADLLTQ